MNTGLWGTCRSTLLHRDRAAIINRDPDAIRQMAEVMSAVSELCMANTAYDIFVRAQDLGFQWGIVYSPEETLEDRHFKERGMQVAVEHPELGEEFVYVGAPYEFKATPWGIRRRPPMLGEDNEAVYGEIGIGADELGVMREAGVV